MGRTFVRQDTQIRNSDSYDDTLAAGTTLETTQTNIQGDLNALRSQMKRAIFADAAGDWYADIPTVNSKKRAISALNTDLDDIEEKRLLFRADKISPDISVTAGQNWEVLVAASSEVPSESAAAGAGTAEGAVVAILPGDVGAHSLAEVTGANALSPKNLLLIREANSGDDILSSGRRIYGLLQAESGVVDGDTFNDTNKQVQISFVRPNTTADDLEACPIADIAGRDINYSYIRRVKFDNVPETAFLAGSFVDASASVTETLDNAIDNQVGPATQAQNIEWRISDTYKLDFQDSTGAKNLLEIAPNAAGDSVSVTTDNFAVTHANTATFSNGVQVDGSGLPISLGVVVGQISSSGALSLLSTGANDLTLNAGQEIVLVDGNKGGSTFSGLMKLSETSSEWSAYETQFGEVSLLNAMVQAARQENRTKGVAVCTANIPADTNASGAGGSPNLDAQLPDYSTTNFVNDVDVYLNGVLLRNGANPTATLSCRP